MYEKTFFFEMMKKLLIPTLWMIFFLFMSGLCPAMAEEGYYTIHYTSYKDQGKAASDVGMLVAGGYDAFSARVDVKGKGVWHRVYIGKYATTDKARQAAEEMKKKKIIDKYFIFFVSVDQTKHQDMGKSDGKKKDAPRKPDTRLEDTKQAALDRKAEAKPSVEQTNKAKEEKKPPQMTKTEKDATPRLVQKGLRGKEDGVGKTRQTMKAMDAEPSGSPLYDQAIREMTEKNYEKALETFKVLLARDDTPRKLGEMALRRMADCHYFLGEKGSKEHLNIAVEFYKNALKSFPDPMAENAHTHFYLAKAYEHLKLYPEAQKSYENLYTKYPESELSGEALFRTGELLYRTEKYNQAADRLIAYLLKYRKGAYAKQAFFMVADCYYRLKQSASAEIWYRDAQKNWPDFLGISREIIINMGHHKYSLRRFNEAIDVFSAYVNLYPTDEKAKEVFLNLASSYQSAAQMQAALNIYKLIVEKYPDSKEAQESILAMASLGVDNPGLKSFPALTGISYYRHPIDAYDFLLTKDPKGTVGERAMLGKAQAWQKFKKERKAVETYKEFLGIYPHSKYFDEARKGLKLVSGDLIGEYYRNNDYLALADIYYSLYALLPLQSDEYEQVSKIAHGLKQMGFAEDYLKILTDYKKICTDQQIAARVDIKIAEEKILRRQYDDAEKMLAELGAQVSKNPALMIEIKKNLAEIYYRTRQYDKAIVEFEDIIKSGQIIDDPVRIYRGYAASLRGKKDYTRAAQNYLIAVKFVQQDKQSSVIAEELYKELGDLYYEQRNFRRSLDMYGKILQQPAVSDLKRWALYNSGRSHFKMENNADAQKIFDQIKNETGADSFWGQLVDYFVRNENWWNKYSEQLK